MKIFKYKIHSLLRLLIVKLFLKFANLGNSEKSLKRLLVSSYQPISLSVRNFYLHRSGFTLFSTRFKKPVQQWTMWSTLNQFHSLTLGTSTAENLRDLDLEFFGLDQLHKSSEMPWSLILLHLSPALREFIFYLLSLILVSGTWSFLLDILHASCIYMPNNLMACYTLSSWAWWLHSLCESHNYNYYKLNHCWPIQDMFHISREASRSNFKC
jgi:hypothetical protein